MKWSVGLTTVPERRRTFLPTTLQSLEAAGWGWKEVRIAVDGSNDCSYYAEYLHAGGTITSRWPRVGAWGSWFLLLQELHIREPNAERYMIVQDDVVFCKNLKTYLEKTTKQDQAYWNLYTFDQNEQVIAGESVGTWHQASCILGSGRKKQTGKGALALVFSLYGAEVLLQSRDAVLKPRATRPRTNIDGCVVKSMNAAGWREHIHNPSLCDHIGLESFIDSTGDDPAPTGHGPFPKCQSFPGSQVDAMTFYENAASSKTA